MFFFAKQVNHRNQSHQPPAWHCRTAHDLTPTGYDASTSHLYSHPRGLPKGCKLQSRTWNIRLVNLEEQPHTVVCSFGFNHNVWDEIHPAYCFTPASRGPFFPELAPQIPLPPENQSTVFSAGSSLTHSPTPGT